MTKIEIGGGIRPRGEGFLSVDLIDAADIHHDLNTTPWPFDDDSVDEVYSSHCLEHLERKERALYEIARICRVGARVVIRVPHPTSELAMVTGHISVLSEVDFRNMLEHFPGDFWEGTKILKLLSVTPLIDPLWFPRARQSPLFAHYSNAEIMDWVPRTAHENEFVFEVIAR